MELIYSLYILSSWPRRSILHSIFNCIFSQLNSTFSTVICTHLFLVFTSYCCVPVAICPPSPHSIQFLSFLHLQLPCFNDYSTQCEQTNLHFHTYTELSALYLYILQYVNTLYHSVNLTVRPLHLTPVTVLGLEVYSNHLLGFDCALAQFAFDLPPPICLISNPGTFWPHHCDCFVT